MSFLKFTRNKLTQRVEKLVVLVFNLAHSWIQRNASEKTKKSIKIDRYSEGDRLPQPVSGAPEPVILTGLESRHQSHYPVDAKQRSVYPEQRIAEPFNIPVWLQEIQPFLANQLSEHTRRAYESDLKQLFRFLESRIDLQNVKSLKADHIIIFRKALQEGRVSGKPLGQATINRKLAVVKSFFNWLKANQIVRDNPAQLVKGFPQSQESALKGLSDLEVCRILDLPSLNSRSGTLHFAILNCLFYLGVRKSELLGLKMGDFDTERGVNVVKVRGKGHRVRILPITDKLKYSIDLYIKANKRDKNDKEAPLFTPTKNPRLGELNKSLNPNAITYIVNRYAKKAGILKKISPHSCRATCISNALDKRATHRSVQALAGWSTPLMIQRYDKRREDLKNSAAFLIDYGDETNDEVGSA